ncbi:MAG: hypothetical protein ACK5D5_10825, partial [Bacteroidota bacterium]
MKNLITILSIVTFLYSNSQNIIFQQIYQCQVDQSAREIVEISSGGFMIAAMNEKTIGDSDIYIIKTNVSGDTLWTKSFGGNQSEYPNMILETNGGNFLIVGYTLSYGAGSNDVYLIKIDINGNLLWSKTYGGIGDDEGKDIIPTSDGNYVITGRSNSPGNQYYDAFLMKIDPLGNIIWEKNYGGSLYETSRSVKECLDGGYILTGQTLSYGSGGGDVYLIKTDSNGNLVWSKTFGGSSIDDGNVVLENPDKTIMIAAETESYGGGAMDVWLLKTDSLGNLLWSQTYGGTDKDVSKTMRMTSDGKYLIGAISRSFGWINPDMWLLKIDTNGTTLWTRHFGSWDHEHCHSAREASDGGIIAVGHSKSYGPVTKIMFIKLDENGTTSFAENNQKHEINIFPNPAETKINIQLPYAKLQLAECSVFTLTNNSILHEKIQINNEKSDIEIDLLNIPPG